jgi:hypothetical protein
VIKKGIITVNPQREIKGISAIGIIGTETTEGWFKIDYRRKWSHKR